MFIGPHAAARCVNGITHVYLYNGTYFPVETGPSVSACWMDNRLAVASARDYGCRLWTVGTDGSRESELLESVWPPVRCRWWQGHPLVLARGRLWPPGDTTVTNVRLFDAGRDLVLLTDHDTPVWRKGPADTHFSPVHTHIDPVDVVAGPRGEVLAVGLESVELITAGASVTAPRGWLQAHYAFWPGGELLAAKQGDRIALYRLNLDPVLTLSCPGRHVAWHGDTLFTADHSHVWSVELPQLLLRMLEDNARGPAHDLLEDLGVGRVGTTAVFPINRLVY